MDTFSFCYDTDIISFLSIVDSKKIKQLSKCSKDYVYYHNIHIKNNAANVIKKFFKYTHELFESSKKFEFDSISQYDLNNKHFKNLQFISINLLYMYEYDKELATSFINGFFCNYKKNLILKYINIDNQKTYSNYDLNKLLLQMNIDDISYIGF